MNNPLKSFTLPSTYESELENIKRFLTKKHILPSLTINIPSKKKKTRKKKKQKGVCVYIFFTRDILRLGPGRIFIYINYSPGRIYIYILIILQATSVFNFIYTY